MKPTWVQKYISNNLFMRVFFAHQYVSYSVYHEWLDFKPSSEQQVIRELEVENIHPCGAQTTG